VAAALGPTVSVLVAQERTVEMVEAVVVAADAAGPTVPYGHAVALTATVVLARAVHALRREAQREVVPRL
jgi:hypothetical protein